MPCIFNIDSLFDCANIQKGGIAPFVLLYNLSDWQDATLALDITDGFITDITNASLKKAYRIEAADETNIVPSAVLRAVDGNIDFYDHSVKFAMFQNDQEGRNAASALRAAPVVAIIYRNNGTGLVYGNDGGMKLTELLDNPQDPNIGNILGVTVATKPGQSGETQLPIVIDAGTPALTKALIESLTTPGI